MNESTTRYWEEHRSTRQGGNVVHERGSTEERTRCGRRTGRFWVTTRVTGTTNRCVRCRTTTEGG